MSILIFLYRYMCRFIAPALIVSVNPHLVQRLQKVSVCYERKSRSLKLSSRHTWLCYECCTPCHGRDTSCTYFSDFAYILCIRVIQNMNRILIVSMCLRDVRTQQHDTWFNIYRFFGKHMKFLCDGYAVIWSLGYTLSV